MELYIPPVQKQKPGPFYKGMIPWNKGKHYTMPHNSGRFKPGHKCTKTVQIGTITERNWHGTIYKYIKNDKGKWETYHGWLWKQHHGPLPEKCIIIFKNGDNNDLRIENLECITRAENMRRNMNFKKSGESIKKTWHREKIRRMADLPPVTGFGYLLQKYEQRRMRK